MEVELAAAALTGKESVLWSITMKEVGFGTFFDSVPLYIINTSALHVASNGAYSWRVQHVAPQYVLSNTWLRRV